MHLPRRLDWLYLRCRLASTHRLTLTDRREFTTFRKTGNRDPLALGNFLDRNIYNPWNSS